MINFKTPGGLDLRAIRMFGLTSKADDESKVGRFGTGLKYAAAVIAREGGKMTIHTAGKRHTITTQKSEFREVEVCELFLDETPLPFTTVLGRDWAPWMAFRELYSNTKDEGGTFDRSDQLPAVGADETVISVELNAFESIFFSLEEHFIDPADNALEELDGVDVYPGRSKFVFYQGTATVELQQPAAYRYNITNHLDLTEDRTAKYMWEVEANLERALCQTHDEEIAQAVCDSRNPFEATLDFSRSGKASETFLGAGVALRSKCNPTVRKLIHENLPSEGSVRIGTLAGKGVPGGDTLQKALGVLAAFCENLSDITFVLAEGVNFGPDFYVKEGRVFLHERTFEDLERMTIACLGGIDEVRHGKKWAYRKILELAAYKAGAESKSN